MSKGIESKRECHNMDMYYDANYKRETIQTVEDGFDHWYGKY